MKDVVVRAREAARTRRSRAARPAVEGLEDRLLMYATTGDKFAFGSRITWSIVPDGTNLGGVTSNLQSALNSDVGAGNWLHAFQDAFAVWETYANVNLVQVGDSGAPTGSGNYQQSNPTFGDIRIGGYAQAANIMAYSLLPPPANGGSDAGDIFFNSSIGWNIGSNYDLETVAFHEIGHALGLAHSADVNAAMYAYYNGVQQSPDNDDVNGVRSIWGPRQEDGLASGNSNFTSAKAADITRFTNGANDQIVLPNQDVASAAESYWFKFTTPANASSRLTVQLQSTYLSELSPKVQIYNSALQGLVQVAAASNAYGATIAASISNATPNTVYYIRVLGSNGGYTGAGAYAMTVNMGNSGISLVGPPNTTVLAQPDQGSGGILDTNGGPGWTWWNGGILDTNGGPGWTWWNGGWSWIPASIRTLEARGDYLMISPGSTSSGTPDNPAGGGGQPGGSFVAGLISSISNVVSQAGVGLSVPGLPAQNLLCAGDPSANTTSADLPTVLIDILHPTYDSSVWK